MTATTASGSPFLVRLRAAMIAELEPELRLACRVAVYQAGGYRHAEIARLVDATPLALRTAEARVRGAAARLDQGDREA